MVEAGPLPEGADANYSGWRFLKWQDSLERGRELWQEYRRHLARACRDRDAANAACLAQSARVKVLERALRRVLDECSEAHDDSCNIAYEPCSCYLSKALEGE